MLPKNTKSFTLGCTQAVNAQYKEEGNAMLPSIVILGSGTTLVLCGIEPLTELKKAIEFALSNSNTQE